MPGGNVTPSSRNLPSPAPHPNLLDPPSSTHAIRAFKSAQKSMRKFIQSRSQNQTPMEDAKSFFCKENCGLPQAETLSRRLRCPGLEVKKAKRFYLKLWYLVIEARTKKRTEIRYKPKSKKVASETPSSENAENPSVITSSLTDVLTKPEPKTAQTLGKIYKGAAFVYVTHEY
ncbi:hypothetical protein BKA69DRAFT_1128764 [Paraphysoderma sedebokerense]|nr:hypothetical protein BKA69DRAFT_1128764 [Paraphysoderma sedebokerense]